MEIWAKPRKAKENSGKHITQYVKFGSFHYNKPQKFGENFDHVLPARQYQASTFIFQALKLRNNKLDAS
jgi:hypothetical protein